jgi:signal peptidase I
MHLSKNQKTSTQRATRKNRAADIANTLELLISILILAIVVRAFALESFRIPTGSMADTLKGAHLRLRCVQCGYKYDHDVGNYEFSQNDIPHQRSLKPTICRCPSCGHYQSTSRTTPIVSGDQIVVLKWIYQFSEPKRWDVIVFKYPANPSKNYIKRLIGRPGETVEIIDGDIYINGEISRKPPKVQNDLWMSVYDNDYQPVRPPEPFFNGHPWQQPFKNTKNSKWRPGQANPTLFYLDSPTDQEHSMVYDTSIGNDFRATYAYDDVKDYDRLPYCSDLKVRFYANSTAAQSRIGIAVSKYQTDYKAWIDFTGDMVIAKILKDKETILTRRPIGLPELNRPTLIEFANVDHQLIFRFGSEQLTYDLGRSPEDAGPRRTDIQPQVRIFGSGKLTLSHIAIFRDIHYTEKLVNLPESGRATQGHPLKLEKDEFFVLGDNSPLSLDSRWWSEPGKRNNAPPYRLGIVPRDYLVGKALLVIWPSGFKPFTEFPISIIPNIGRMRLIYGGK